MPAPTGVVTSRKTEEPGNDAEKQEDGKEAAQGQFVL